MKIVHTPTKKILADARWYRSPFLQAIGLIGRTTPFPILFDRKKEQRQSLHMWFVFCTIDVLFLNSKKQIVEIKRNFRPFQCYTSQEKARYVVELPVGTTCKVGDRVSFK